MGEGVRRRFSLDSVALAVAVDGDGPPTLVIGLPGGERIEVAADTPRACRRLREFGLLLYATLAEVDR